MKVTVLGTGIMGAGVSRSLLSAGHDVTVWNRTRSKAATLEADGATVADSPDDAVRAADAVLVVLFDAVAVTEVMQAAAGAAPHDAVWVQTSTIGLDGTRAVVAAAERQEAPLVEAMMLGTKAPAESGKLTLLVAGDRALTDSVADVFDAIAAKVLYVGPTVGAASALKLACNAWVAAITAATAQSLSLAGGLGLEPTLFLDAIEGGPVDSTYAHLKGAAMLAADWTPSFEVDGVVKDVDLMIEAAAEADVEDALLQTVRGLFARASDAGHGHDDMAAVMGTFTRPAGGGGTS